MNIILTGAGFTKNFGGFLADEMWAVIFNHPRIKEQSKVRNLMLDDFDYESIYHKVLREPVEGLYGEDDKTAIKTAISWAYKQLDKKILDSIGPTHSEIITGFTKLINGFANNRDCMSYFFTLNQDLLIERCFSTCLSLKTLNLPGGIPIKPSTGSGIDRKSPLSNDSFIKLPNKKEVDSRKSKSLSPKELHYIKLHGSYNWKSCDGSDMLVIGKDKEDQINREPLLEWYFEIFKETLSKKGVRLLVIGYGFLDKHINEIIASSVKEHGLQIYVVSPQKPSEFMNSLYSPRVEKGHAMYEGLYGYFPYDFSQVFPSNGSESEEYKMIIDSLFS